MNNAKILSLVRKHLDNGAEMQTSARFCLADAITCRDSGDLMSSNIHALRALQYLVGIWHPDYKKVDKYVNPT